MIETAVPPRIPNLLTVAAGPEDLLDALGAIVGSFVEHESAVRAVLLSDGRSVDGDVESQLDRSHRIAASADRLGVDEVVLLDHRITDVPRLDVPALVRELLINLVRPDAILVADPSDRRARTARGRLTTYRAAVQLGRLIGVPLYCWAAVAPDRVRVGEPTLEVLVSRTRQRSAMLRFQGIPEVLGRVSRPWPEREYLTREGSAPAVAPRPTEQLGSRT
ncbi:PIG-L family deacetylase [Microlunatus parietis]|uniref:LmbE family N-acetylglucosaminyl deacetylase n=1 Tax=Microlunatus parietis TaxID=682979 RepID=A0A7Y9I531_9ACTN|nr:hypothetical protein [Microlunatus parietis]NYE70419.1 LmbE family N-acetylglucosaminyl deacetylase [Microlunatus parietis]